jgi:hypothetical protein
MESRSEWLSLGESATYKVRVQGGLDGSWSNWFHGMTVAVESDSNGPTVTTLTGTVADQAALHGLLDQIRDLGLPLLEVKRLVEGGAGN